jgi:uncharacterized SAM-binding protein YcdF (DUF218 family)
VQFKSWQSQLGVSLVFLALIFGVTWWLFDWLTSPSVLFSLILLSLVGLTASFWRSRVLRKQPWLTYPFALILFAYLGITSPPGSYLAEHLMSSLLPADAGMTVEQIVVLGRGSDARPTRMETVEQLWRSHRAKHIFISGMGDADESIQWLQQAGIPGDALAGEKCSENTWENATFTSALLSPRGIRRILLVTDRPHLLRSFLTFRSFGFEVIPHPSPLAAQLTSIQKGHLILREFAGLISYGLQGRYALRRTTELESPSPTVTQRISEWNCKAFGQKYPRPLSKLEQIPRLPLYQTPAGNTALETPAFAK